MNVRSPFRFPIFFVNLILLSLPFHNLTLFLHFNIDFDNAHAQDMVAPPSCAYT